MLGSARGTRRVAVIGHRGAMGHAPENTLASFERAIELGADIVECDVRLSRDGVPVLLHDPTLERTTTGWGPVGDYTAEQIAALDAGARFGRGFAGQGVPTLHDLLGLARGRCLVALDLKPEGSPGVEEAAVEVALERRMQDEVFLFCFDPASIARAKRKGPSIRATLSFERLTPDPVELAARLGAQGLTPRKTVVSRELVAAARAAGLFVAPWTVNRPEEMRRLVALGVDGIITNYPDRLCAVLDRLTRQP